MGQITTKVFLVNSNGVGADIIDTSLEAIKVVEAGKKTVGDETATVTTAGTRVQLPDVSVKRVMIQAHESNTGTLVVGGSTVVAALAGRRGHALYPTQYETFEVDNLNLLYIDSTQDGDKVNYYYEA